MMSDIENQMAKMHQQLATDNSKKAVDVAVRTKLDVNARVDTLERAVNKLIQDMQHLQQKYNLLLTERFDTGPTVKDE